VKKWLVSDAELENIVVALTSDKLSGLGALKNQLTLNCYENGSRGGLFQVCS
jgi:hypothetical protein